jgi:hypothetical protein
MSTRHLWRFLTNKEDAPMKVLNTKEAPINELRYAAESMASFAVDGMAKLSEVAERLKGLMPSIAANFEFSKEISNLQDVKNLSAEEQKFLQLIEPTSFAEVRIFRADVPEGFSGNLLAYASVLAQCAQGVTNLGSEVLLPYTVYLAQLMSKDKPASMSDNRQHIYIKMQHERDEGNKAIEAFFKGNKESQVRVGEVLSRNADWKPLFDDVRKAVDAVNAINRNELSQQVAQAEEYLRILGDQMEKGNIAAVTPEAAQALAEGAFQVASHIEFYAVIHFRVLVLANAVKSTVERINKILG